MPFNYTHIEMVKIEPEDENKYFDRKSCQIRVAELAPHISAFANADGGTLVIGISDKKRIIEGINACGNDKINGFINAPKDCCRPMPRYKEEFIDVVNVHGEPDRVLLLHIEASTGQVIRTANDRTYLRIGDKSKEMLGENLRNLEYAKGSRHYEDEINSYATLEDLDDDLLNSYKEKIGAESIETSQVLRARGFLRQQGDKEYLTNAAVLLFAKNIMQFYSNCRVRFLRIDGRELQVGDIFNIIKDKSIDIPILRIIDEAKNYISDQLRVFITQDIKTGKFIETPEYPEFPWLEGIVNAVAHRDYSMTGCFIKISMYDDRLEIESPGCLPDVVTVNNIRETRFSRNPKISRVLTEFGWVRELNEGVKKIFIDMSEGNLEAPMYSDYANTVRLTYYIKVLGNSYSMSSLMITNFLMGKYGVTLEELHALAMENLEQFSPVVCVSLMDTAEEVIADGLSEREELSDEEAREHAGEIISDGGMEMYYLSNEFKINGAVCIVNEKVQQMVADQVGGDYYVLPSSVHEVIIVPKRINISPRELTDMVNAVNTKCVSEDEYLSDNIYQYDAKEHKFSRCVPERNLKKNLELDLEPAVDVQEEKNTLQSELPEQSHEPMKHSGRIH